MYTHIYTVSELRDLAPQVDSKKLLKLFMREFNTEGHSHVTEDFVVELFNKCGIDDAQIAVHLFRLVWNEILYICI